MARARNIKPSFFKNELLGEAEPLLGLLFISLWTLADKAGRLEDRPLRIKAETFPYRENIDINSYLTQLLSLGFIERYEANGIKVIEIVNFTKHQTPHSTEKQSELPCKPIDTPVTLNNESASVNGHINVLIPDSLLLIPDSIKKHVLDDGFEEFWNAYPQPRRKDKVKAHAAWKKVKPPIDEVLKALTWQVELPDSQKNNYQFFKLPATYINAGSWKDEMPNDFNGSPF
jgi:hypothetical protein